MILLTTSRRPTDALRTFCRDLANGIPDVVRVNRGKMSLDGVAEKALEINANKVVVVDRWREGIGKISFFNVKSNGLTALPPILLLSNIIHRRDFGQKGRSIASVITVNTNDWSKIKQTANSFSEFFSLPIMSVDEAAKKRLASMHFMLDSSGKTRISFMLVGRMVEIGPQVTVSKLVWEV